MGNLAVAALAVGVILLWRALERAGQPGWAVLVPLYGLYSLVEAARRPRWWAALLLVPYLNAALGLLLCIDLARGRGLELQS